MERQYPTIQELNNTLDEMRKMYKFDDKRTNILFNQNIGTGKYNELVLEIFDEQSKTTMRLSKEILYEDDK